MVGFPVQYAVWVQGLAPTATFIGTFPSLMAVERYGRRPVVLASLGGTFPDNYYGSSVSFHVVTWSAVLQCSCRDMVAYAVVSCRAMVSCAVAFMSYHGLL